MSFSEKNKKKTAMNRWMQKYFPAICFHVFVRVWFGRKQLMRQLVYLLRYLYEIQKLVESNNCDVCFLQVKVKYIDTKEL